jgi:SAM-dependent methyltransferase
MDRIQKGYYGYQFVPDVLLQRIKVLQSVLPLGSRLVDLGCNDGTISLILLKDGHAASSVGLDFEDVRRLKPNSFAFISADLRQFDLRTLPEVDVILCLNVIHHLCKNGIDFAREFMALLSERAGTVICEMGSLTAVIDETKFDASWLHALKAEWQTDQQCWADLFRRYRWRRPLLTYPFQFGRRVMWKLVTDREQEYGFDLLDETNSAETTIRRLRRTGTQELFWAKAYHGRRCATRTNSARRAIREHLKDAPHECLLPLETRKDYGDVYAFDPELAMATTVSASETFNVLSSSEYREVLDFAARTVPGLDNFPIDVVCDFRVARTERGLSFFHFEPSDLALTLLD